MASPTFSTASTGEVTTDRTMLMGSLTTPFAVPSFFPFLMDFLTACTGAHTKPPATETGTQTGDVTTVITRRISFVSLRAFCGLGRINGYFKLLDNVFLKVLDDCMLKIQKCKLCSGQNPKIYSIF